MAAVPENLDSSAWSAMQGHRPFYLAHLTLLHLAPPRFVTVAAEAGYAGVSLHITPPGLSDPGALSYPMLGSGSVMMRETLARLRDLGVVVHDIQAIRLTPQVRLADFLPMLEAGALLGASYVIVVSDDPDEDRNVQRVSELAEMCAGFGLRLALEFMAYSGIRDILQANRIIARSLCQNAVILLDALHLERSGGTAADVMQIDQRLIPYVQVCDAQHVPSPEAHSGLRWEARRAREIPGWGKLSLHELVGMLPPDLPLAVEVPSESLHRSFEDATIARMALDATRNLCNQVMVARARRGE